MYVAATRAGNSPRNASAILTAGLKCAPGRGPNVKIKTVRVAPVGSVLQRKGERAVAACELGGHDATANDAREQERGPQELRNRAPHGALPLSQRGRFHESLCCSVSLSSERSGNEVKKCRCAG
jgi:hypothetical protein